MNMNYEKDFKYGIIDGFSVMLFNETEHKATVSTSDFLINVKIKMENNGVINIQADRIIYDFYDPSRGRRIFEKDWIHQPHPRLIHEGKRWWKVLTGGKETERFVYSGYVRSTETESVQYILPINKYTITIYD